MFKVKKISDEIRQHSQKLIATTKTDLETGSQRIYDGIKHLTENKRKMAGINENLPVVSPFQLTLEYQVLNTPIKT